MAERKRASELTRAERYERKAANEAMAETIFEMANRGESYSAIARATGVPQSSVHAMVRKSQAAYVRDRYSDHTEVIGRELALLDSLTRKNVRRAQEGDRDAAAIVFQASRDRRKLLGLDAAIKAEITIKTPTDIEIERLTSMLADGSAEREATGASE